MTDRPANNKKEKKIIENTNSNEFVVRSNLYRPRSVVVGTLLPIVTVVGGLIVLDSSFYHWRWWLVGSFILAILFLETGPQREQLEVVVTIHPLCGIVQLTTWKNDRPQGRPRIVPLEVIQDCIVQEYVGAFHVTTNVVFRLWNGKKETIGIEPAFPGIELSFTQCLDMKNRIQRALLSCTTVTTTTTTTTTGNHNNKPKRTEPNGK